MPLENDSTKTVFFFKYVERLRDISNMFFFLYMQDFKKDRLFVTHSITISTSEKHLHGELR